MFGAPLILPKDLPKKKVKRARKRKTGTTAKKATTAKKTVAKRAQHTRTRAT